jgi:hypothetical protein
VTDRDLLDELKTILDQVDPVPTHLEEATQFVPPTNATLMTWLADSATAPPPGTRGTSTTRSLRFTSDDTTIDLRLETAEGQGVRALGLIYPPRGGEVQIHWPRGSTTSTIDPIGWFRADTPTGPLRFEIDQPGLPTLTTGWFIQ